MSRVSAFGDTFATLRAMLARNAGTLLVTIDKPGDYQLCSKTLKDRAGRPLFVAAVQTKKTYVSYHLMPVYAVPDLVKTISPSLRKRMQGKACFNFTTIQPEHVKELSALTKKGIAQFKHVTIPWAK